MISLFVAINVVHYFGFNVIILMDVKCGFTIFHWSPSTWWLESEAGGINNRHDCHWHLTIGEVFTADASIVVDFAGEEVLVAEGLSVAGWLNACHHVLVFL